MNLKKEWYDRVDSTNLLCKKKAMEGAEEGLVILAKSQSDGRGRMGRSFFSPEGCGLYMSVLLRPRLCTEDCTRLTALAAVAVCRAVAKHPCPAPKIKWVNDVYLEDKKLCGILTQAAATSSSRPDFMIVGIGINLILPEGGFPEEIRHLATALYPCHPRPDALRDALANEVLEELFRLYRSENWQEATEEYRRLCFLPHRTVRVSRATEDFEAEVLRVNEDLSLLVRDRQGREITLRSGEVSLKL